MTSKGAEKRHNRRYYLDGQGSGLKAEQRY